MRISYIQLRGFRGFRKQTRINIPAGFAVVVGPNGAGKSTLCDAIEFVLTGTIRASSEHREKGESIDDYLWWRGLNAPTDSHVQIGVVSENGVEVAITRSQNQLTVGTGSSLEDLLIVQGSALENPLAQLCRTAILRDEEITKLSVDLRETDRFDFVRASLGTADFHVAENSASRVTELLSRNHDVARRDYEVQRDRITQLTIRLTQARAQAAKAVGLSDAESTLRRLVASPNVEGAGLVEAAQRFLQSERRRVDQLRSTYSRIAEVAKRQASVSTPDHVKALTESETAVLAARQAADDAAATVEKLRNELKEAELASPRNASIAQLVEHGTRLGLQDGKCPLCGSEQDQSHFDKHIESLRKALQAADSRLAVLSRESAAATLRASQTRTAAEAANARSISLKTIEEESKNEFEALAKHARALGLEFAGDAAQAVTELAAQIDRIQGSLAEVDGALSVIASSLAATQVVEIEREIAVAKERLQIAEKQLSGIARAQGQIKEATAAIRRLQGELVDEQLAALSPLLVELYERLRPHVDWLNVRYNLRGDVRRMLSLEVGHGLNPNFVFSSGQRRAAGLAFLTAIFLSRSWCKLKTLILDDPVQHVDDYRALHLTEVLAAVRRLGHQIICTVEDRALAELLARRLRRDFEQPGTVIELGYASGEGSVVRESRALAPINRQVLVRT